MSDLAAPHLFHADLSAERLNALATLIRDKRAEAFDALPDKRATWGGACTAYETTMLAFQDLSTRVDWLGFYREQGLAYSLRIGEVPVRVQRSDHAPKAVLRLEGLELSRVQTQVPLFGDVKLENCMLRLEFVAEGPRMGICELRVWGRAKIPDLYYCWELGALSDAAGGLANVTQLPRREPDELPPADFAIGGEERETKDGG